MSTASASTGRPIQASDTVTCFGTVQSISGNNIVVQFNTDLPNATSDTYATATLPIASCRGSKLSGAGKATPQVGDKVTFDGVVQSISGSGSTATLTLSVNEGIPGATIGAASVDNFVSVQVPSLCTYVKMTL
jgi:hypothetical protein